MFVLFTSSIDHPTARSEKTGRRGYVWLPLCRSPSPWWCASVGPSLPIRAVFSFIEHVCIAPDALSPSLPYSYPYAIRLHRVQCIVLFVRCCLCWLVGEARDQHESRLRPLFSSLSLQQRPSLPLVSSFRLLINPLPRARHPLPP